MQGKKNNHGKKTTQQFVNEFVELFGDKYDTSRVVYEGAYKKVCIICPEHGEFWISPHSTLSQKRACPVCGEINGAKKRRLKQEEVVDRIKEIHGEKYDLSKVEYISMYDKIELICPEHGSFWIRPHNIISGKQGCPVCGNIRKSNAHRFTTDSFISKAKSKHGEKYDYSKTEYKKIKEKVCIICHKTDPITGKEHGAFWQTPDDHLAGCGCPRCSNNPHYTVEEYIEKANIIHNGKFTYELLPEKFESYTYKKIKVTCPIHGPFEVLPYTHLSGSGCPICKESKLERSVAELLRQNNISFKRQAGFDWLRFTNPMTLDFYLPEHNIAIECQGRQHFIPIDFFGGKKALRESIIRDKSKFDLCYEHGIRILYYTDVDVDNYPYEVIRDENVLIELIKKMGM